MSVADILSFLGHFLAAHREEWDKFAEENDKDVSVNDALIALIALVLQEEN